MNKNDLSSSPRHIKRNLKSTCVKMKYNNYKTIKNDKNSLEIAKQINLIEYDNISDVNINTLKM